jgi:hypothetical protein
MSVLDIITCTLVISLCTSIGVGAVFYYKLNKKHEEEVGILKAMIDNLEHRWVWLEERYVEHMAKYH